MFVCLILCLVFSRTIPADLTGCQQPAENLPSGRVIDPAKLLPKLYISILTVLKTLIKLKIEYNKNYIVKKINILNNF